MHGPLDCLGHRDRVKVDRIPEEGMIQILAPDGSDQAFHERVRHWGVWHRFDFLDLQDPKVREPSMKAEQWVVIRTDPIGRHMSSNGPIEHAADRRVVDVLAADAKADDAPGEHIDDHKDPIAAQQYRFATKQVNAPEAVLGLCDEGEPGGAGYMRMFRAVISCEDPSNDVLINPQDECT